MPYLTPLDGCPLITAANREEYCGSEQLIDGVAVGRGWQPRDYAAQPYGSLGFARPTQGAPIPRSEWAERIRDRERAGAVLTTIARAAGVRVYHQQSTNYCWINAPAKAVEICRVVAGQPHVLLSPASGGAIIKGYRNVGGWGTEAVEWIAKKGLVPQKLWPANAIERKYSTPQADAERAKYQFDEWYDIPQRSFAHLMTHLLYGRPVPIGLSYWGHEVLAVDPIALGRDAFGVRIWNSYGESWGQHGLAILDEEHATPDDAVACGVVTG